MKKETLTKSEHEIMNLLWHVDKPLTASEIVEQSTDRTWKDSYIHLLINSLLEKEMIRAEGFAKTTKNYARTFVASVSEEEYAVRQITGQKGMDADAVTSIVSALIDRAEEPALLIEALEAMLAEKRSMLS
ncbi:MAG: BlaI/MecI/CopY family transcriptional regulator [Hominenteromicrobium sp.]